MDLFDRTSPDEFAPLQEEALRQISRSVVPESGVQNRIRQKLEAKIAAPGILERARESIQPPQTIADRVWSSIRNGIEPMGTVTAFDRLRDLLTPSQGVSQFLKQRLMMRLEPSFASGLRQGRPVAVRSSHAGRIKWVAAFALVLVAVRASPLLFLPQSVAESPLILLPTKGEVSVLIGGLWQPVSNELSFTKSALIQTHEGEATIVLHDDGVVRMAPHTTIALHDTSDRPQKPLHDPTLTLHAGRIWMQGLVPAQIPGLSVATSQGKVIIHEGSVSIEESSSVEDTSVTVRVWDRKGDIVYNDKTMSLVSGEGLLLSKDEAVYQRKIAPSAYNDAWVSQNLLRDSAHRHEIAQSQHERRIAAAGILPTSRLYPVKRAAEAIDVAMTFGQEAKAQKMLDQANTRLNEASALIAEGNTDAAVPLQEYKDTLTNMATGSGQGSLVQFLVEQELKQATAQVAAALPDDPSYLIKRTVFETSAALPDSFVTTQDIQGVLLVDTLSSLMRSVEEGKVGSAKETFAQLKPYLAATGTDALSAEMQKEAKASLSTFALALSAYEDEVGGVDTDFLKDVTPYLPKAEVGVTLKHLSEAELNTLVQQIYNRIFIYKLPRSRWNQLMLEFRSIESHPDRGSILRRLYNVLPENGLARYVPGEFERLKEAKAGEDGQPTQGQL